MRINVFIVGVHYVIPHMSGALGNHELKVVQILDRIDPLLICTIGDD